MHRWLVQSGGAGEEPGTLKRKGNAEAGSIWWNRRCTNAPVKNNSKCKRAVTGRNL
jgi:hypothetical protein